MPGMKPKVRKVQTSLVADFDDQLWPINVALLILAGFVAGIIIATSDFHDPRLLYNGWVRLASVGLMTLVLFLGVMYLQGKMLRRLQLCILLSLLFHLVLLVYLHDQYLALLAEREKEDDTRVVQDFKQITVPDYNWQQFDDPETRQFFEEPIEHEAPKPMEPEAVKRKADQAPMPTEQEAVDEPQTPQIEQPNPAITERVELSAPRRADAAAGGQVSRQEWKHRPQPNEPIPEPEITTRPREAQAATVPEAKIAPRKRQETQFQVDQRQTFEEIASTRTQQIQVKMARQANRPEEIPDTPTTPVPTRQTRQAAEIPRTEALTPDPAEVARQPVKIEVRHEPIRMTARRQAAAPRVVRQTAEADATTPPSEALAMATSRQRAAEQPPQATRATRPVPSRRPTDAAIPREVNRPQKEAVASTTQTTPQVNPANLRIPNRAGSATSPSPVKVLQQAVNRTVQPAPGAVVQSAVRRQQESSQPSSTPRADRPTRLARAQETPQLPAEQMAPTAIASKAPTPAEATVPTAQPRAAAVNRSASSPTQVQTEAPGRALPAMTSAAQLPSAIAVRRPTAVQQRQPGTDAAPSRPTTLARADAGTRLPSTALEMKAALSETPAAQGTTAPSKVAHVPNSAAVRQAGARPAQGDTTAAAGAAEMAIGATQVVARAGQQRATGDNRPTAYANAPAPRMARSPVKAASLAVAGAAEASPVPPSHAPAGSEGEAAPAVTMKASAAKRGGTLNPTAPQPTMGVGPAGSSGTPGPVGIAQTSRMTRIESTATAIAGGGTPKPGRTTGGEISPDATAEPTAVAVVTESGGKSQQASILAPVSGARQHIAGLPGAVQSQPMAGAAASLTDHGATMPEAVARRSTASQKEPGENSVAPARTVTMKRSRVGADLPTAAAETEMVLETGTGGVTVAQGPSPSTLEKGPSATVRQAAADVAVAQRTAAAGSEESGLGSARVVALAGKARETGGDIPTPSAGRTAPALGRTTAVAVAAAPSDAEPAAEQLAGGPDAESGASEPSGPPTTSVATAAVAREAGGVASAGPSEATGELAGPEGGAVTIDQTNRAARLDALPDATAAGAAAGPRRTMGALEAPGDSTAAAELADAGPSSGGADAAPDIAAHANVQRPQSQSFGLPGNLMAGTAVDSATESGPAATTPGKVAGQRRLPRGNEPGPSLAADVGRGPVRRLNAPGLPQGASEAIAEEPVASSPTSLPGEAMVAAEGTGAGEPSRREGGLPVQIAAMAGPGGLSDDPSLEVGLVSRQARRESEIVHTVSRRFVVERSGGHTAIDGRVREEPAKAFRQRDVGNRGQVAQSRGGTEGTEKAVEMGLDYYARNQFPDGRWSLHELPPDARHEDDALGRMKSDSAATGLALLSYLGAGYTHLDEKHRGSVKRGLDWLVRNQKEDGDLFGKAGGTSYARFYSHGIATMALCEAYGMTKDPELREPARKAVDYILKHQHPERGGWRYRPGEESDTSVTGWQMMALKSAQMAGLDVPDKALKGIDHWLDLAENPGGDGRYVYNPYAKKDEQLEGRKPSRAMTAEAMLMRMYLGYNRDDPKLIAGAEYLKKNLPAVGTKDRSLRDCYYWYYATQAMFHMQGDYWKAWNDNLRPLAQRSQIEEGPLAGSWHPKDPVPDRWGHAGGRHYVTGMHLLMLEVYYRHLPLFKELGGPPEAAEPSEP